MSTVLSLLKLQLDNKTDLLKLAKPKVMASEISKKIIILLLATLAVSFAISKIMIGFKVNAELLSIVLFITQVISLVFAVGNVIHTLYLSPDNAMLVCLPVTPDQLFISKLLMIYVNELLVSTMVSFPILFCLGRAAWIGTFGISYYLSIPLLILLLPILPIVVAAFVSVPLMFVIRFLKRHTLISVITVLVLVGACLYGYVSVIGDIMLEFDANDQFEIARTVNAAVERIGKKIPVYYHLAVAMTSFKRWYSFAMFILICAIVMSLTFVFTRYFFFKIAMSSLEKTVKSKKRPKKFKKYSPFKSLFVKEIFCVFRSATEIFEYFLFTLMMPFIVFVCDRLVMSAAVNEAGDNMKAGAHVMVLAILAMLSNISSASAVSRDGGNFYTSKIVPINYYTQIFAKFAFNAVFTVGALALTGIISVFIYPVWQVVLGTLAVAMAAVGHIAYCIDSDIKDPTPNLQGNEGASEVGKCTPKCIAYGLCVGFILGLVVILMSSADLVPIMPYLVIIAASFVFMVYRVYTMILRINLTYDKIEM